MKKKALLLVCWLAALVAAAQPCHQVIGYCANWQWYDRSHLMNPMSIPYEKYTVLNYCFFRPQSSGHVTSTDDWADQNLLLGQINWSTSPVSYYPNTNIPDNAHAEGCKVVISIGGWNDSYNFPTIASSPSKRATFAHDCVVWVDSFNLDGIDIDWEYPDAANENNFTLLMQQVRDSLNAYETLTGKEMLLTGAFGASAVPMSNINWPAVVPLLDYINLMTYDYNGPWGTIANHNSPLFSPAQGDPTWCADGAIDLLTGTYAVPSSKINIGVAFYGRSMKTSGTPALFGSITGAVDAATFPDDEGMPLYYNLLPKLGLFNMHYDAGAAVPYLTGKNGLQTFVSYDNPQSIAAKAQYVVDHNLAGAIIWEISGDMMASASNTLASTPLLDTLNAVFCNGSPPPNGCANVSNLSATATFTSITFSWTVPVGVDSVSIRYKPTSAANFTTVKRPANVAFTLTGLALCTPYMWEAKSHCATSEGNFIAGSNVTTQCCNTPTGLAAAPSNTSAVLTWANTGATSYLMRWRPKTVTTWTTVNTVTGATYNLANLTACTEYYFQVRPRCGTTLGAWSTSKLFKTTGCTNVCNAPTGLAAAPANTSAVLTWSNTGATSYHLRHRLTSGTTWTNTSNIATNSKTISGLTACANYTWQVRSTCGTVTSAFSSLSNFTTTGCGGGGTPPPAPSNYCSSYSLNSSAEWVQSLSIGSYTKNSGNNNGFGNFIDQPTLTLYGGSTIACSVAASYNGIPQTSHLRVWIDYNRDGDFDDVGENPFSNTTTSATAVTQNISIPANVSYGYARLRVALRRSIAPAVCEVFSNGEVEDYVVLLQPANGLQTPVAMPIAEGFHIFPNPTDGRVTASFGADEVRIRILNVSGIEVRPAVAVTPSQEIDLSALPAGLYLIEATLPDHTRMVRQVVRL